MLAVANSGGIYNATTSFTADTWYHVAIQKGTALRMFIDGKLDYYSSSVTTNFDTNIFCIGRSCRSSPSGQRFPLNGYISDFQILIGKEKYNNSATSVGNTVLFTPHTASFSRTQQGSGTGYA